VGPDLTWNGSHYFSDDAFVAKVKHDGSELEYCGYIGGANEDHGEGIAVDETGSVYVVGFTRADHKSFPVKVGPDLTHNGYEDVFVAKVKSDGTDLEYCGYIGGENRDMGYGISVDGEGCAYITGNTQSDENTFPVKIGPDLSFNGDPADSADVFAAKINPQGTDLVYCGYIGGDQWEYGESTAVDPYGNAFIVGYTASQEDTFPVKLGPDLSYNGGTYDGFAAMINESGTGLIYCGFVGGDDFELCTDIALGSQGNLFIIGYTASNLAGDGREPEPGFYKTSILMSMVEYWSLKSSCDTLPETGGTVDFTLDAGEEHKNRNYILLTGSSGAVPGYGLPGGLATLPLNWDSLTDLMLLLINSPVCVNFMGSLNSLGQGSAQLNTDALPPGYVGRKLCFAYGLNNPFDFASTPVEIEIVP
jgi:hypothetical protein